MINNKSTNEINIIANDYNDIFTINSVGTNISLLNPNDDNSDDNDNNDDNDDDDNDDKIETKNCFKNWCSSYIKKCLYNLDINCNKHKKLDKNSINFLLKVYCIIFLEHLIVWGISFFYFMTGLYDPIENAINSAEEKNIKNDTSIKQKGKKNFNDENNITIIINGTNENTNHTITIYDIVNHDQLIIPCFALLILLSFCSILQDYPSRKTSLFLYHLSYMVIIIVIFYILPFFILEGYIRSIIEIILYNNIFFFILMFKSFHYLKFLFISFLLSEIFLSISLWIDPNVNLKALVFISIMNFVYIINHIIITYISLYKFDRKEHIYVSLIFNLSFLILFGFGIAIYFAFFY